MTRLSGIPADVMEELRAFVRRGGALLDRAAAADERLVPKNWRELIDKDELDMAREGKCVLGQLAQRSELPVMGYGDMCVALNIGSVRALGHGFVPAAHAGFSHKLVDMVWRQYLDTPQIDDEEVW